MHFKASLGIAFCLSSSLSLAKNHGSAAEPSLWEKAKKIGNEVWTGSPKGKQSDQIVPNKRDPNSENSDEDVSESSGSEKESLSIQKSEGETKARDSQKNRSESDVSLFYIPFSTGVILPSKKGFAGTWILGPKSSLEAEYLSASYGLSFSKLDIALFSEIVISAKYRWYTGNSFNLFVGAGQRTYKFSVGNDLLAIATNQAFSSFPSLVVENQVLVLGLGNRWQFDSGFTLGFDWLELIVPIGKGRIENETLAYFKDEDERDNTEKILKLLRYGPTVSALKLGLGYTF